MALRRAGLALGMEAIGDALDELHRAWCIGKRIPLSDGGLIVSVTREGLERLRDSTLVVSIPLEARDGTARS